MIIMSKMTSHFFRCVFRTWTSVLSALVVTPDVTRSRKTSQKLMSCLMVETLTWWSLTLNMAASVDSNSLVSRIPTTIPHLHRNSVGAVVFPYGVICTSAKHRFALEMMRSECFRLKTYFLLFIIPSNSILLLQIIDLFFASLRWFFSCLLLKFPCLFSSILPKSAVLSSCTGSSQVEVGDAMLLLRHVFISPVTRVWKTP